MQTLAQLRLGELQGSTSLRLSENLTHFPEEIFSLSETLEVLDLSANNLSELPAEFGRLKKLKTLFCSDNKFEVLPEVLADCPLLDIVGFKSNLIHTIPKKALNINLRWLILTNNRIKFLPSEIGNCVRMQKLMLAGNQLTSLPESLSKCLNLGLLRISANLLEKFPNWLLGMPKLSWLAFLGNPFSEKPAVKVLSKINWVELETGKLLGEGASGTIYKAIWDNGTSTKEVAIKLFKGAVTSDGLPEDEMSTCITAGDHFGLVKLIGQIDHHPNHKEGLVMELIPSRFSNLGNPPSLVTCTRDVFSNLKAPGIKQVLKIAATIASVAQLLHKKGIMHGDLYAHNTLTDPEGNTLFGDFGAASFYNKEDQLMATGLERLEISAFGYLLDDLLTLCAEQEVPAAIKIAMLRDLCWNVNVDARPDFKFLLSELIFLDPHSLKNFS
ncbi:MAG: leucine-rich repeat-containing protein kinase family protein [Bacteroidota bacterium]